MTFWSENHQILFATAEYLAGQFWPDALFRVANSFRNEGSDKSRPTGLLGWQRMERARPRILRWLNDRLSFGFSEWNSPGYYDEDFTALFNLADFCLDEKIRTRACMVLDLLIFDLARFTHKGSFGVTAGRCYFESKNCGYEQSVGDLIEILFGTRGGVIVERSSTCAGALVCLEDEPRCNTASKRDHAPSPKVLFQLKTELSFNCPIIWRTQQGKYTDDWDHRRRQTFHD
jgi:hypothetical protein